MRRDFGLLKNEGGFEPGDEYAMSKATALAQLVDAPTIERLVQIVSMLDLFGGQCYVQALRRKVSAEGELIPEDQAKETPGQWQTVGYVFRFETVDAAQYARRGEAFTVTGPIEVQTHDDAELGAMAVVADGLQADDEEPAPTEPEPVEA
jgi:hypothetical protein